MLRKTAFLLSLFFAAALPKVFAQTYEQLVQEILTAQTPGPQIAGLSPNQQSLQSAWQTGKLIDKYLLEGRNEEARPLLARLTQDLDGDIKKIYYFLQFARAYPDSPPEVDLPWGYYQYFLAIDDPRERLELAGRALSEKWNWEKMRAEVKAANRDNKEFIFTDTPGKTGVYRVVKAKRGPYDGQLVLDLGFSNYFKASEVFEEYQIVQADCSQDGATSSCKLKPAGDEKDLFTYPADVLYVLDGDTFVAVANFGFGITTRQIFRLWGLNAPEINTKEGREAKKFLEELLMSNPVLIRTFRPEKYGRFLADVWAQPEKDKPMVYVNQALVDRGFATADDRQANW